MTPDPADTTGRSLRRSPLDPDAEARVFCFPYAGGGASIFADWQDELPEGVEACPVQLPGREERFADEYPSDLDLLVRSLADDLEPHVDVPFALFGHSFGALIAFELARELRRRGAEPHRLLICSCLPPEAIRLVPPISQLPGEEFLEAVVALGGVPPEVAADSELLALVEPVLRLDLVLYDGYVYRRDEPLDCPFSIYVGSEEAIDGRGWASETKADSKVRVLPGGHFMIHSARSLLLPAVADDLAELPAS